VQSLGAAPATSDLTAMRSLWRLLTGEIFATVTDAIVDTFIDLGMCELNRRLHFNTSQTTLALTAGTQEYSLPTDFVDVLHVRHGSQRPMQKGSTDQWEMDNADWQNETGEPLHWALYANKLVLRPTPTAAAVALAASVTLRYVAMPPTVTTNGFLQLAQQDQRLAVYWGAYIWSACYPDSAVAQQRAAALRKDFEDGTAAATGDYGRRSIST
jgi:hypothetical protein